MKKLFMLFFMFCCFGIHAETAPMEYRYWDLGASPKRDIFQYSLLKLVLEKTSPEYGPYKLVKVEEEFTPSRAAREISRGEIINIEATPHRPQVAKREETIKDQFIMVGPPLLKGLLGYRRLVVRRDDLEKFNHITRSDQLKALVAGQGRDWADINIYRNNGYQVSAHATLNTLFAMLLAKRFDYIPLGVIEADNIIQQYAKESSNQLAIVPHLAIYYPFPVHFNISINHPELAGRIEKGLAIVSADGSLDDLFEHFFGADAALLKEQGNRVFYLHNPEITDPIELNETSELSIKFIH